MVTIQRIVRDELNTALYEIRAEKAKTAERSEPYVPNFREIESRLTARINNRIYMANLAICKGEPRIRAQPRLEPWQIAEILAAAMDAVRITPQSRKKTDAVRVRYPDGSLSKDGRPLIEAALAMNSALTKRGINQLVDRLLLICPECAPDGAAENTTR